MDYVQILESVALGLCSLAVFLWMAIGSLSRTTESEIMAQRVIAGICITSALLLFIIHYTGGEIWGSRKVARPSAAIAVIVALASMMNIKGRDVQGEANPHNIMKMRREEE
ncbi:MAG: hypothetical protein CMB67_05280 [Euryarchaeota archaeon]|nr:hypothetical protein [Euryarchaeota archaeon]